MIKKSFVLLIAVIFSFSANFLFAEEKRLEITNETDPVIESVEITPNPVGRGDLFTITIIVDYNNSSEVDFSLDELPESIQLWSGPYIRSFVDSDPGSEKDFKRKIRITAKFKAWQSGRVIIPSLTVIVGQQELKTEPQLLRVGVYKKRNLYMPIKVEWQAGFDEIYAGEAVPIYLTVKNQEVVSIFDRVRVSPPREGFFEMVSGLGEIRSETTGNITLYDVPAATYIYTIPAAGKIKIPAAGVDYKGVTGWTDNLFLTVKRLPQSLESGAVGSFSTESYIDKNSVESGGDIVLRCTVSGDGNLNYLKMPEPSAENCILISSNEIKDYTQSIYGYSGRRTVEWIFNAEEAGKAFISVPEFEYFEKQSGSILTSPGRKFSINVKESASEEAVEKENLFTFEKVDLSGAAESVWKNRYKTPFMYIWLLPAAVFWILVVIMKGRRPVLSAILAVIIMVAIFSVSQVLIGQEEEPETGPAAAVLYNQSVDKYHEGNLKDCLHYLRTAIYIDPLNSMSREMLAWIESENGFINSVRPSSRVHPDIFFYLLAAAVNGVFLLLVISRYKPSGGASVLLILFGLLLLFSVFMIIYTDHNRKNLTGIVFGDEIFLKKIPREAADLWLTIEEGEAVKILDESNGFLLVETGFGIQGWIDKTAVLKDRLENFEEPR